MLSRIRFSIGGCNLLTWRDDSAPWDNGEDCKRVTRELEEVKGASRHFSEVIKLGYDASAWEFGFHLPRSVQRQRGRDNRTKTAIRSPRSGVESALGPRTGMLLVIWAVGTPITCSSSSLTIRCPDRIGHQARSWHRDNRKVVTGSRRSPIRTEWYMLIVCGRRDIVAKHEHVRAL